MADSPLDGMQDPRPLSPELRARLEEALLDDDVAVLLRDLDAPRPLTDRSRLTRALRPKRRWPAAVAAGAVAVAAASVGVVLLTRPAPVERPPAVAMPTAVPSFGHASPPFRALGDQRSSQQLTSATGTKSLARDAIASRAPALRSVSPFSGPTTGGTWVTIRGLRLATNTSVEFGGVPAVRLVQVSDDEVQALTPPHLAGAADVVVTTPDGRSAPLVFLYLRQ